MRSLRLARLPKSLRSLRSFAPLRSLPVLELVACLVLGACSHGSADMSTAASASAASWVEQATPALKTLATGMVTDMEDGNFATTTGAFDATMRGALSEEQLVEAWRSNVGPFGELVRVAGASVTEVRGDAVVVVVAEHSSGKVAVQLSFTDKREVNGLFLRQASPADLQSIEGVTAAPVSTGANSVDHPVTVGPHQLRGTLVTPRAGVADRYVVVLLVAGSGPNDMDETVGPNAPLRDLADGLAAQGVSSLRYDKRYHQAPQADAGAWTLETEVLEDVDSALALLKEREAVRGYSVVVAGHSLGAMLLPGILARHPEVSAGISLAGSPRNLLDILNDQLSAKIKASGTSEQEQKTQLEQLQAQVAQAKQVTDASGPSLLGMPASYLASLNATSARLGADVAAVSQPLLVLQGSQDAQCYPDVDYPAWQQALTGKDAEFQLLDGLNHLFIPVPESGDPLDYTAPAHVDSQVVAAISTWLAAKVG